MRLALAILLLVFAGAETAQATRVRQVERRRVVRDGRHRLVRPLRLRFGKRARLLRRPVSKAERRQQRATERELLRRGRAARKRGEEPWVLIAGDHVALYPRERTIAALTQVGEEFGIPEMTRPESLAFWPGGVEEGSFARFWAESGLQKRYGDERFAEIHTRYRKLFTGWYYFKRPEDLELLARDQTAPGLASFARRLDRAGIRYAIWTGRREATREATIASLRGGLLDPSGFGPRSLRSRLFRRRFRPPVLMVADDQTQKTKGPKKARSLDHIPGTVIAVLDERRGSRDAALERYPDALSIKVIHPGYLGERDDAAFDLRAGRGVLYTFEQ